MSYLITFFGITNYDYAIIYILNILYNTTALIAGDIIFSFKCQRYKNDISFTSKSVGHISANVKLYPICYKKKSTKDKKKEI